MEARLRPTALTIKDAVIPADLATDRLRARNDLNIHDPFGLKKRTIEEKKEEV